MFQFQKLSNYGTSTPAVARTLLQAKPIIDLFECTSEQSDALKQKLWDLQRHLLKCVECRDALAAEIASERTEYMARPRFHATAHGAVSLPGVGDLQSKGDTFLQSAKLAIAATGDMVEPFYGEGFGHKYHKFAKWAEAQFGPDDVFAISLGAAEAFVKIIVQMRNAVDHPKTEPGAPMVYANFALEPGSGGARLVDPRWGLTGAIPRPMIQDFDKIIESIIRLGEQILINLFEKFRKAPFLVLMEIPESERDPANPQRLVTAIRNAD